MRTDFRGIARCLLAEVVYRSGLFELRKRWLARNHSFSLTLMYHRVLPQAVGGQFLQAGMYVEPKTFEQHLRFLAKNFDLQPVSALYPERAADVEGVAGRPPCAVTFDDGWSDFYRYAYPLLLKYQVPATVFLPTGFIGTQRSFWTERLGRICTTATEQGGFDAFKSYAQQILSLSTETVTTDRGFQESMIQVLKLCQITEIESILSQLEDFVSSGSSVGRRDFLTWEEVAEMQQSGLVTFGSHTENHLLLDTLCREEIVREIESSKQTILSRQVATDDALSFCYPNGNYTDAAIRLLDECGYVTAFTTQYGVNDCATSHFKLKRIGVHQDISASNSLLAYRIFSASVAS